MSQYRGFAGSFDSFDKIVSRASRNSALSKIDEDPDPPKLEERDEDVVTDDDDDAASSSKASGASSNASEGGGEEEDDGDEEDGDTPSSEEDQGGDEEDGGTPLSEEEEDGEESEDDDEYAEEDGGVEDGSEKSSDEDGDEVAVNEWPHFEPKPAAAYEADLAADDVYGVDEFLSNHDRLAPHEELCTGFECRQLSGTQILESIRDELGDDNRLNKYDVERAVNRVFFETFPELVRYYARAEG